MPSRAYFLDASALVHKYSNLKDPDSKRARRRLAELFALSAASRGKVTLQIPNICMAECAKTFAKFALQQELYGEGEVAVNTFRTLRGALLNDASIDRIINSYELKRRHFEDIEEIFVRDHAMPGPRNHGDWLSSHDALIISMATEFARSNHESVSDAVIVTCDRRIVEFCVRHAGEFAAASCVLDRDIV